MNVTYEEQQIYRKVLREYEKEDATYYADRWLENNYSLNEGVSLDEQEKIWNLIDFDYLVDRFEDKCSIEIADEDTWRCIIQDYLVDLIDSMEESA